MSLRGVPPALIGSIGVAVALVAAVLLVGKPRSHEAPAPAATSASSTGAPPPRPAARRLPQPSGKLLLAQRKRDLEARIASAGAANVDDLRLEAAIVTALARAMDGLSKKASWEGGAPKIGEQWIGTVLHDAYVEADLLRRPAAIPPALARMFDPSAPAAAVNANALEGAPRVRDDDWIAIGVNVPPRSWPTSYTDVLGSQSFSGMRLVNQLFVHAIVRRVWGEEELPETLAATTERLAARLGDEAAQELDFGALEAARCAVLLANGYPDRVKRRAIEAIVAAQGPDGLFREVGDKDANAHATYFALWALAGYQRFLARPAEPTSG